MPASAMPTSPASVSELRKCTSCCWPLKGKDTCRAEGREKAASEGAHNSGLPCQGGTCTRVPLCPDRALKESPSSLLRPTIAQNAGSAVTGLKGVPGSQLVQAQPSRVGQQRRRSERQLEGGASAFWRALPALDALVALSAAPAAYHELLVGRAPS